MRNEFGFDRIRSVEFCVHHSDVRENFLIPSQRNVQEALKDVLEATAHQIESIDGGMAEYEFSEKYASREALVSRLDTPEMGSIHALYDEEGWAINLAALQNPGRISYYFAVFRDDQNRKLLGVRRATQFKGIVKSHLVSFLNDSLTMVDDRVFKLDHEFDFLITDRHVYILHPNGFESIAAIEAFASERAAEKTVALGEQVRFVDFSGLAGFVANHKRAARIVAALTARADMNRIRRRGFEDAARETGVGVERRGSKIRPLVGSELAFLELLDDRRYTTAIRQGGKAAFVAASRKPIPRR